MILCPYCRREHDTLVVGAVSVALCQPCKHDNVEFRASIAAPGRGNVVRCLACDKELVAIGSTLIDPHEVPPDEEPPWVMDPSDVA